MRHASGLAASPGVRFILVVGGRTDSPSDAWMDIRDEPLPLALCPCRTEPKPCSPRYLYNVGLHPERFS